jgi:ATPase subunit of ABC transporter with duplicated ATPase domains
VLTAKALTFRQGVEVVLAGVSLSVTPQSRIGVVGPNGVGKSTFLQLLAGLRDPESGRVDRSPRDLRVGYLAQEPDASPTETVREYLARRTGVAQAGADLDRVTALLQSDPSAVERYSDALEQFLALGGGDFEVRVGTVAASMGFPPDRLDAPVRQLSGGEAARAGLAAILLSRFDVFLLDEPTNNLDFAGLAVLEGFVTGFAGAAVVVSHDRVFLDRTVNRILEIEEHHRTATEYAGGWSEYIERRALARAQQTEQYEAWVAERGRLHERIRSQRAWSETGVRKATRKPRDNDKAQRGFFTNRTEKQAAKVRQSERALERLGTATKPWEGWQLHMDLSVASRSGDVVARLEGAKVAVGGFALGPIDVEVNWADRIAITGANGGGKSTLLRALFGPAQLAEGTRFVGPGVVVGELDQRRLGLGRGEDLLAGFGALTGLRAEESRSILAKFGLSARHVTRSVNALSPGERTRAQLAALMATGTNCLVLDEPTNHLDLPAIEQLEEALGRFDGTLLLVSHDRWLIETLAVDRTWVVEEGRLTEGG